ncbi:MAG: nucleotidyltransferase family protein, partial [Firmicutes bacterium]|nr:nucleotidyltransferase family protein [Bacillota bacterium]
MKAAGIICEFNPLHNGHKYILDSIRRDLSLDAV